MIKIADIAKELQTDQVKLQIYRLIDQFVKKNFRHYYKQYQGSVDDLTLDFYAAFTAPKKHRNGEVFSELDRYDGSKLGGKDWNGSDDKKLAAYVQRFVINRLIDKSRTDHSMIHVQENYDDEEGNQTFDRLAGHEASDDEAVDNIFGGADGNNYDDQSTGDVASMSAGSGVIGGASANIVDLLNDPDNIFKARDLFDEMDDAQRAQIMKLFKACGDEIDPKIKDFIEDLFKNAQPAKKAGPRSRQLKNDMLEDVRDDIEDILPEGATVENYTLQKRPAARVMFPDKTAREAFDQKGMLDQLMSEAGFEFYKPNGSALYYFKRSEPEQTADSKFRVYYPSKDVEKGKLATEDFGDKASAEDFAANFGRTKCIIHEISDSSHPLPNELLDKLPAEVEHERNYIMWPADFDLLPTQQELGFDVDDVYFDGDKYSGYAVIYDSMHKVNDGAKEKLLGIVTQLLQGDQTVTDSKITDSEEDEQPWYGCLVAFGKAAHLAAENILNYFANNSDDVENFMAQLGEDHDIEDLKSDTPVEFAAANNLTNQEVLEDLNNYLSDEDKFVLVQGMIDKYGFTDEDLQKGLRSSNPDAKYYIDFNGSYEGKVTTEESPEFDGPYTIEQIRNMGYDL